MPSVPESPVDALDRPPNPPGDAPRKRRPDSRPPGRSSPRFAIGLLLYLALTILSFLLVWRYAWGLVVQWTGGDIKNPFVQFGLYTAIYLAFTLGADLLISRLPLGLTRENRLRAGFLAGATVSLVVAQWQQQWGWEKSLSNLPFGILGTFMAALVLTRQRFHGLVEVVGAPSDEVVAAVKAGHAGVRLADEPWDRAKRAIELVLSLALIFISLPIAVPLAILLWLQDPGPLVVAKVAVKRGGSSFRQLKLRSMIKQAEGSTGPIPAAPEDRRVTRLGGLLRRSHIDELPQIVNILKGEMSLVGPRPERTVFVLRHLQSIPGYARRHSVRPGLAGMAQVYGDYYSTPRQKLHYDVLYIRRRSLGLDAKLFTTAVLIGLFGIRPHRRHAERRARMLAEGERWEQAYAALRGEAAPGGRGATHGKAEGTSVSVGADGRVRGRQEALGEAGGGDGEAANNGAANQS